MLLGLVGRPGPGAAQNGANGLNPRAETHRLTVEQAQEMQLLLDLVDDAELDMQKRVGAAVGLLGRNWPPANQALVERLGSDSPAGVKLAVARALARHPAPARQFAQPLIDLIGVEDESLSQAVGMALGRYENHHVAQRLAAVATDTDASLAARRGAIAAMAEHRRPETVGALVQLAANPDQPAIRSAATSALQRATGISQFGSDARAWGQWWQANKDLPPDRWLEQLVDSLSSRNRELHARAEQLTSRLTDAYTRLYIATPIEQRPALLKQMLGDPVEALRFVAMNQIERALLNAQPIGPEIRQIVLDHLSDPNAQVRAKSAALLRDLGEESAADAAAERLLAETEPTVQVAYLSLLSTMPRAEAVEATMVLLGRDETRAAAAACLAAAEQAQLLDPTDRASVIALVREHVDQSPSIEPALVRLLGQLSGTDDPAVFVALLDNPAGAVRLAAADVIIERDLPIGPLLQRLGEPDLATKAIEAAARRGKDWATVELLLNSPPADATLRPAWRGAIAAIAGRLPLAQLQRLDQAIVQAELPVELRIDVLKQGLGALPDPAAAEDPPPDADSPAVDRRRAVMLLTLGQLYLQVDQPRPAAEIFQSLRRLPDQLDDPGLRELRLASVDALLRLGEYEAALGLLNQMPQPAAAERARLAGLLLDRADTAISARQLAQAQALLAAAENLIGLDPPEDLARHLADLRQELQSLRGNDQFNGAP
jgi:hypothetical protein